jgi:hypothetical protein
LHLNRFLRLSKVREIFHNLEESKMTFVIENHLWMAVIDTPQAYEHKHVKGCRVEIFNHVRYAGNDEKTNFSLEILPSSKLIFI